MKASELRIGNYVAYYDTFDIISGISINIIHTVKYSSLEPNKIKPIPLTEEWLLKFGFEKISTNNYFKKDWGKNGISFIMFHTGYNKYAYELGKGKSKIFYFVHQLQNFHFAYCEEELNLKD